MGKTFEVRDIRHKEKFFVDDEYLNGYARLCGWKATLVYFCLCRYADKHQKAFPSVKTMADKLGVSERTINRAISDLEKWGIVTVKQEKTKKGVFRHNTYFLLDKSQWKKKPNASPTTVEKIKESVRTPLSRTDVRTPVSQEPYACESSSRTPVSRTKVTHKEGNTYKDIAEASSAEWKLEEKLQQMEKKPNSYLDIIATFIREKPVRVENAKQLSNVISRYSRVAKKLEGAYTNDQIFSASKKIKRDNDIRGLKGDTVDWTLETIYKYLTK